jgi:uncharacterized membrane protein YphA (DoxX/SURF4 family)
MPTLLELQRAVGRGLAAGDDAECAAYIIADGIAGAARLAVYRNTFIGSLTTVLRLVYPAVHRLVGAPFFESAARLFIEGEPPQTAWLDATDYPIPFLPPMPAADMAVTIEVTMPVLLVLGLLTRASAAVLLGMTAVIEIFVYPQAWPTHIQWAAMLFVLLARGPGKLSLDWLVRRWFLGDA